MDRLLEKGANVNAEGGEHQGKTAVWVASKEGHLVVVDRLLEKGANANADAGKYYGTAPYGSGTIAESRCN